MDKTTTANQLRQQQQTTTTTGDEWTKKVSKPGLEEASSPMSGKGRLRAQRMELRRQTSCDGSAGLRVDKGSRPVGKRAIVAGVILFASREMSLALDNWCYLRDKGVKL